jgi:hypothetical protein
MTKATLLFCLTVSIVLFATETRYVKAGEGANLVKNGDFEEWPEKPGGDAAWGAAGYDVRVGGRGEPPRVGQAFRTGEGELDTEKHGGKYAQYVLTTTWGNGLVKGGIRVTGGKSYRVGVWVKLMTGRRFMLRVLGGKKPWGKLATDVYGNANGEWTRHFVDLAIPEGCDSIAVLLFIEVGSGYIDDLEVTELAEAVAANDADQDRLPRMKAEFPAELTRKRVAVFSEPGFPSESPREVEWYRQILTGAGCEVALLGVDGLKEKLSPDNFDTLILATGGNFPREAEAAIEKFLAHGGTVLVDGHMMMRTAPAPEKLRKQIDGMKKARDQGEGIYAYYDFMARYDWNPRGNVFTRDATSGEWIPALRHFQNYDYVTQAGYPEGLDVQPWPNDNRSIYARPFSEEARLNPALQGCGLPEIVPPEGNPSREGGALRLTLPGGKGFNSGAAEEYACDLLLPLYYFEKPSGADYLARKEAGISPKDCETDFYAVRYHDCRLEGGTLLHFGNLGAQMLTGGKGGEVLLAALRVAESTLPGEAPQAYVKTAAELRLAFSAYANLSIKYRQGLRSLLRAEYYLGGATSPLLEKYKSEQEGFDRLSRAVAACDQELLRGDAEFVYGHQARLAAVEKIKLETERLEKENARDRSRLAELTREPEQAEIRNPFGRIYFGLDSMSARGELGWEELRAAVEKLGLRWEGLHATGYRLEYVFNSHFSKTSFKSGVLDPKTGEVKPKNAAWMETGLAWDWWRESNRWQLEHAARDPRITMVWGGSERDMEWSLWGERTRLLFVRYLTDKYGDIGELNRLWKSEYESFDKIALPVRRPVSRSEHALWEEWTRFREVYRLESEFKPMLQAVAEHAPGMFYLPFCTYNQHHKNPANGVNFYEYGKMLKVNGFEHQNLDRKEWLANDIAGMFAPNCTSEWGAFYFPPDSHQDKIDLLRERLWSGIVNGQVGWGLFTFSVPGRSGANYFDCMNLPLPLGSELGEMNREFSLFDQIILDGRRDEAPVRIVYSPTTRRHTSWPGEEGDLSFRNVSGLYSYFKYSHIHARAIDEQAVWEGHLPKGCKLLILPEVIYENRKLHEAALRYLKDGGSVLVTVGSGKFNELGERKDGWLTLAQVAPCEAAEKVVALGEGVKYFSAANAAKVAGLNPLYADEVKILAKFADGTPALTETKVGAGRLFVTGLPLGEDCEMQWSGNPAVVDELLKPVYAAAGVGKVCEISSAKVAVRPWTYNGERYLLLNDRGREGVREIEIAVPGSWRIFDYLLGAEMPVSYDGECSRAKTLLPSPGGMALKLVAASGLKIVPREKAAPAATETAAPDAENVLLDVEHPFAGRIWAKDGAVRMGDFSFELEVETGGGWGGKLFMTVRRGKELFRKMCEAGQETVYPFTDAVLRVQCEEITAVYPVNLKCRLTVEQPRATESACTLTREKYCGQDSLLISNGLLSFRLLPTLGGRMVALVSQTDNMEHSAQNRELIANGAGESWGNLGGMEENGGAWPGPYWNAEFEVEELVNTDEEIHVRLTMKEAKQWTGAGSMSFPKAGTNRLVKEFSLRKGESRIGIVEKVFNEAQGAAETGLRVHPGWAVGGDADAGDCWLVFDKGELKVLPYPFSGTYEPAGDWTALVDRHKRVALIHGYDQKEIGQVYAYGGKGVCGVETWARIREVEAGGCLEFPHTLELIRGLSSIGAHRDGGALNIDLQSPPVMGAGVGLDFDVEAGAVNAWRGELQVEIRNGEKTVMSLPAEKLSASAGSAVTKNYQWEPGTQPDGEYAIVVKLKTDVGAELECRTPFRLAGGARAKLLEKLDGYVKILVAKKEELAARERGGEYAVVITRKKSYLMRAAILLEEMKVAGDENANDNSSLEKELNVLLGSVN